MLSSPTFKPVCNLVRGPFCHVNISHNYRFFKNIDTIKSNVIMNRVHEHTIVACYKSFCCQYDEIGFKLKLQRETQELFANYSDIFNLTLTV